MKNLSYKRIAISGVLVGLVLTVAGYMVFSGKLTRVGNGDVEEVALSLAGENLPRDPVTGKVLVSKAIAEPASPPEGYVEYRNEHYGFSFYHSPESKVTEFDEGQGAITITLENHEKVLGLQIFIVPYSEPVITEERFLMDVPSGARENVKETYLGLLRVPAVTFNSFDGILGETREVWFLYGGFLFEITTFKGLGDWFAPIMQTWIFL